MKARAPRQWESLSKGDKKIITDYCLSVLQEQQDKDMRIILELFIKMMCTLLHDTRGFGEKRLTIFIGDIQILFREQQKLVSKGKQLEFLNKRMSEIFVRGGFPQSFVDNLLGKVDEYVLNGGNLFERME